MDVPESTTVSTLFNLIYIVQYIYTSLAVDSWDMSDFLMVPSLFTNDIESILIAQY